MNRPVFILMNGLQLVISDALRDSGSDKQLINILGNKESTRGCITSCVFSHIYLVVSRVIFLCTTGAVS